MPISQNSAYILIRGIQETHKDSRVPLLVQDTNKQLWHAGSRDRKQQDSLEDLTAKETTSLGQYRVAICELEMVKMTDYYY